MSFSIPTQGYVWIHDLDPEPSSVVAGLTPSGIGTRTTAELFSGESTAFHYGCVVARIASTSPRSAELLKRVATLNSALNVVYLAEFPNVAAVVQVMRAGAFEVLDWPSEQERLRDSLAAAVTDSERKRKARAESEATVRRFRELSLGEREVLGGMLRGMRNNVIAKRLGLALRTVEARRHSVFAKLGTRSIAEIAGTLHREKLVDASGELRLPLRGVVPLDDDAQSNLPEPPPTEQL